MNHKKERNNQRLSITLPIATGYVTIKKFEELTGLKPTTIRAKIKTGELLVKKGEGVASLVLINMYDFCRKAAEQSDLVSDWQSEG